MTTHALITETGASPFAVTIEVSGHRLTGDEPVDAEGANLGPAPYDLLTAALGECTAMTIRWYARKQGWPLEKVEVSLTHHKEGKQDVFTKRIRITGEALTEEQHAKLLEVSAKCPIQRTLEGTPHITTEILD